LLIGNGPLKEKFKETNAITIKDFSSSEKLVIEAKDSSIFCLPSRKEPWGVVIHEFASAGMALLTSSACGANTEFLRHGYNGYIFKTNSKESLKNYLQKLMNASDNSIAEMGNRSHQLAQHVTPEMWATSFMSVLDQQ
jgi:glycosyltransferase involved in cell wall biosynthesis